MSASRNLVFGCTPLLGALRLMLLEKNKHLQAARKTTAPFCSWQLPNQHLYRRQRKAICNSTFKMMPTLRRRCAYDIVCTTFCKRTKPSSPPCIFVAKVMDRLPILYRLSVAPLVKSIWLRVFAWFTAFCTITCVGVVLALPGKPKHSEPMLSLLSDALMIHSYLFKLSDCILPCTRYALSVSAFCVWLHLIGSSNGNFKKNILLNKVNNFISKP